MSFESHGYLFLTLAILAVIFGSTDSRNLRRLSLAALFAIGGQLYYLATNYV